MARCVANLDLVEYPLRYPHGKGRCRFVNRLGHRYGRLTVIQFVKAPPRKSALWLCACGCGNYGVFRGGNLISGNTLSCGCVHKERCTASATTHGMRHSPEYYVYCGARSRCTNPAADSWLYYGGRGIEFRFTSFEQFFAELGSRPSAMHSVDRKDTNGHYEPGNVRWATASEQAQNRRPRQK